MKFSTNLQTDSARCRSLARWKSVLTALCLALSTSLAYAQVDVTATGGTLNASYTTLKGAFDAINAGTHNGTIAIGISANTTETATAALNSGEVLPANYLSVSIAPTGGARIISGTIVGAIVKLNGADNVTIDGRIAGSGRNLTIENTNVSAATAAVWLSSVGAGNGVTNSTVRNCELRAGATSNLNTNATFGIIMCGASIAVGNDGNDNDNNSFIENRITRCRYGIVTRGAAANLNQTVQVLDNIVGPTAFGTDHIGKVGIFLQGDNNGVVRGNTVQFVGGQVANTTAGADRMGIALGSESWSTTASTFAGANYTVTRNLIHDIIDERTFSAMGVNVATTNGGAATNNLVCSNMIYHVRGNGTAGDATIGIGLQGGSHTDHVVYNSLRLTGDVDPGTASATSMWGSGIRIQTTAVVNPTIKNNAIYIDLSSSSTAAARYYCISGPINSYAFGTGSQNNNDYFFNTGNAQCLTGGLGTVSGSALAAQFATLANWQAAYTAPQDANSIQADPGYTSATDLHSTLSASLDNVGSPVGCAIDFDNEARHSTTPDIGADEFTPLGCFNPQGSAYAFSDCGNSQFYIMVTVTALSGAPSVDVGSDFPGDPGADAAVGVGTYQIGPFPSGSTVIPHIQHNGDPLCDVNLTSITYDCAFAGQNALSFDGVNDRVNCGSAASLNITGTQITLEAWIYPTAWRANVFEGGIIVKEGGNSGYMLRAGAGGTLNFAISRSTPSAGFNELNSAAGTLSLNTWQHVAGTYDGTTQRLFLNGAQVASATPAASPIVTTANAMYVGGWATDDSRCFVGKIDEARVWNVARNPATLASTVNQKLCGTESGLVAYYQFDQGQDGANNAGITTLTDLTANANNGTLSAGFALNGPVSNWVMGKTGLGACVPPACTSPTVNVTFVPDCVNNTFTLNVNVTNLGSAPSIDLTTNPGGVIHQDNVGTGVYNLGPFPLASSQTLVVVHNSDPTCNLSFGPYSGAGLICNDNCAGAIPLACNSSVSATTIGANNSDAPGTCVTVVNTAPGIWYTVTGTGLPITASLCGGATWDTKLAAYTGTCGALTCVTGVDDNCGTQSTITWNSTLGTTYYVYVTGFSTNSGAFTLTISCATCLAPTATTSVVPDCANNQFSLSINITSMGNATSLGLESTQNGIEQTVTTTGTYIMGPYPIASTQAIFLRHNLNATCDASLGNFSGANVLCNDACTGALPIVCGQTVTGTNTGATADGVPSQCAGGEATVDNGVWWTYVGDDSFVTLSLCASTFDTRVHVFQGTCAGLIGVNGNDDSNCSPSTLRSTVTFNAVLGTTYYIAVEGFGTGNGSISMTASCGPLCTPFVFNDACGAAEIITVGTNCTPTGGNLTCAAATPGTNPCGLATFQTFPDAWYEFTATAPNIFVNLTYPIPGMQFAVYQGTTCSPLPATFFCSGTTTSGAPTLVTGLTVGQVYRIRVLTLLANACPFTICVQNLEVSDQPCSAVPIDCGITRFGRTTGYLNTLPVGGCTFTSNPSTGGVNWWKYTAVNSEDIIVTTCGLSVFDTRISVYRQTPDCNALECIGLNDNTPGCTGGSSELVFGALAGETYLIVVHGAGASNGNYQITTICAPLCTPSTVNDKCATASPLVPVLNDGNGVPTTGDNTCAYTEQGTSCSGTQSVYGVWYTFNSGPNNNGFISVLGQFEGGGTANDLSYALFNNACTNMLAAGELACDATGQGADQPLPPMSSNTEYKLLVYNAGGIGTEGTFQVMVEVPAMNDAGISSVSYPSGLICTTSIEAVVEITNHGELPLGSASILYSVDNGAQQVFNWVASSAVLYGQSVLVELPAVLVSQADHTMQFTVTNPNGVADVIAWNDTASTSFSSFGESVTIEILQDRYGSEITYEIYDALEIAPIASGGPFLDLPSNGTQLHIATHCLPLTFGNCFTLRVLDSFNDGICCSYGNGGWSIKNASGDLLLADNFHGSGTLAGSSIYSGSQSPAAGANPTYTGHEFCLPKGACDIEANDCGVMNNVLSDKVYCKAAPGSGSYQFEFSNPDQAFRRRISSPVRYVKFSQMQTNPLVAGVTYFARARRDAANDGFLNDNWGSGCNMALDLSVVQSCPQLVNDVDLPTHSCGVTKSFGYSDKVWATPILGATQYRFRFDGAIDPDGANGPLSPIPGVRSITQASYVRVLNWATYTLVDGETYNVQVEVLVNGVWSGYCGPVCTVTIDNPAFAGMSLNTSVAPIQGEVMLFPNPTPDGFVNLSISGLTGTEGDVLIDIYDVFGKRVFTRSIGTEGATELRAVLNLGSSLANGMYMVDITIGDRHSVQRLSIQ